MTTTHDLRTDRFSTGLERLGGALTRYGLVLVIGWIGALKFTSAEAHAIEPLVSSSPLLGWLYDILPVTTFSALLGALEIGVAALIAVKPWWPALSMAGSAIAIGLFATTLSFLFTTPGVFESGSFGLLSMTGQFLIKDVALLGISVWTLSDSLHAQRARRATLTP